ncbi:EVI2B protein, partial [Spelaeornis formosus]|nr:EVI2B protein [Elachura formosa]
MVNNQVLLVLLCGEIWSCLLATAPHHTATTENHTGTTATSPATVKAPLHPLQATGPSLYQLDTTLAVTEPQAFPGEEEEAGDGSWVAGLIIGIILIGMMLAVVVILLWKCCMRPAVAESHWAGQSPFVDGDMPDLFVDSDQATKRSSVLFMLPWRLKQGTSLQEAPTVSENPAQPSSSPGNGQPSPPALGCSGASTAPAPAPAPGSEAASTAAHSCPPPDTPPECLDLPPPPDWLREAPEPGLDPSTHSAPPLEAQELQPPPPELLIQETHGTLPQPETPE